MSLVKFNDNLPVFSNLLENFFGRDMDDFRVWSHVGTNLPAVNIRERNEAFELEIAAPGMQKEDFKVTLDNGLLTIATEKKESHEEKDKDGRYTKREFNYRSFTRSFTLPNTVDHDQIGARYTDGILYLSIPKKEEAKKKTPKLISIS
jgi:HSP20 family protein